MARRRFGVGEALRFCRREADMLRDHVVTSHRARQAAAAVGLEVERLARFLDDIVEDPLLVVSPQMRPALLGPGRTWH